MTNLLGKRYIDYFTAPSQFSTLHQRWKSMLLIHSIVGEIFQCNRGNSPLIPFKSPLLIRYKPQDELCWLRRISIWFYSNNPSIRNLFCHFCSFRVITRSLLLILLMKRIITKCSINYNYIIFYIKLQVLLFANLIVLTFAPKYNNFLILFPFITSLENSKISTTFYMKKMQEQ